MSFQALFYPKNIAIIGASRSVKTVGNDVVKNLVTQGFEGGIFPINPNADILYGKKVYAKVADVPEEIDLAIVVVPAIVAAEVIREAAAKGARAAVVISAGFKEIGNLELETQLSQVCEELGVTLVGPNCLGVINPDIKMNASFAATMPGAGNIAFVSQSGALCTAVLDYAQELGIGFSKFVSIGNKADINELKMIKYLAEDPDTKVIVLYVEQLTEANKIIEVIRNTTRGETPKPVIIIKAGRTAEGATAVASHTGSLSGGDAAYTALFAQSGVIRAKSISDLFEFAKIFSKNPLSKVERVAIVTNAGGPGVLTTDEVIESGLKLAQLSPETISGLKAFLPPAASLKNPIDVLGDAIAERYEKALTLIERDPNVDGLIVILTPQSMTEISKTAHAIINLRHNSTKPITVSFMGHEMVDHGVKLMKDAGVVTCLFPEQAARAMAVFGQFYTWSQLSKSEVVQFQDVNKIRVSQILAEAKAAGKTHLPETQALEILEAYHFPLLKSVLVTSGAAGVEFISANPGKYAMKIMSPEIIHKTDVGGIKLNVTLETVTADFDQMIQDVMGHRPDANIQGVILMEMAPKAGVELILGVNHVAGLGTMIMFGMGGIFVEVLKDVAFGFAPLTQADAARLIVSLRAAELFKGVRGKAPLDVVTIADCLLRLSQLVIDFPEIAELDMNPLLAMPAGEGTKVLDARVLLKAD